MPRICKVSVKINPARSAADPDFHIFKFLYRNRDAIDRAHEMCVARRALVRRPLDTRTPLSRRGDSAMQRPLPCNAAATARRAVRETRHGSRSTPHRT